MVSGALLFRVNDGSVIRSVYVGKDTQGDRQRSAANGWAGLLTMNTDLAAGRQLNNLLDLFEGECHEAEAVGPGLRDSRAANTGWSCASVWRRSCELAEDAATRFRPPPRWKWNG